MSQCALPVPWATVSAALAVDPRWTPAEPESIECVAGHRRVFRIRFPAFSAIWKSSTPWEAEIQARIATELDHVVPDLYGRPIPLSNAPGDLVGVLMEDVGGTPSATDAAEQLSIYGEAAALLARVHEHFVGDSPHPPETRGLASGLNQAVPEIPALLRLTAAVAGVPLEETLIREIERIGEHFPEHLARCESVEPLTLIHGDFHPANILHHSDGRVRIIDWAAARAGPPEWDLVMCGERQISQYLAARGSMNLAHFHASLRSAVVVRMFQFIHAAIGLVFGGGEASIERMLMSIPLYAGRLVEAGNAEHYRGGSFPGLSTAVGRAAG